MNSNAGWDPKYEWKAVLVLSLGFGLVSVDRFMIMPVFPTIMEALDLNFADLGVITGALALAWGLSSLFLGNLADRIGHRKVLIGAMLAFSLLVGASGLATGLAGLIIVRVLMGFADGAYTPVSISVTIAASKPTRHGLNIGLLSVMSPLLGLAATPIIVTQLLQVMEWRWVFVMLMAPGLLVTAAAFVVLREHGRPAQDRASSVRERSSMLADWKAVLSRRNPKILMLSMLCWLTCLIVTSAMLPHYLTEIIGLSIPEMGFVMSAIGFGAAAGCVIVPAASDRFGRKPVMALAALASFTCLLGMVTLARGASDFFWWLCATHFFNFGLITLTVGTVSTESVPLNLMATSSGLVTAAGELLGGGLMPIVAGLLAEQFGIGSVFYLALAALAVGFVSTLALEETAPRRVANLQSQPAL